MASTNFLPFDPNKENVMGDTEYNSSQQRLNGVQGGIASSKLHNKTMIQTSLVAAAIAQYMVSAGYDALDTDTVAGFADKLKQSILANQTGLAKATTQMVEAGTDDTAYITSYLLKHFYDYWRAGSDDLTPPITNSTDYITPQLLYRYKGWTLYQRLESSGTFVVPDNVFMLYVYMIAGGGAGGGALGESTVGKQGEGGGSGGRSCFMMSVTPGDNIPYVVGAGGAGSSGNGGNGGDTIFGKFKVTGGTGGRGNLGTSANINFGGTPAGNATSGYGGFGYLGRNLTIQQLKSLLIGEELSARDYYEQDSYNVVPFPAFPILSPSGSGFLTECFSGSDGFDTYSNNPGGGTAGRDNATERTPGNAKTFGSGGGGAFSLGTQFNGGNGKQGAIYVYA